MHKSTLKLVTALTGLLLTVAAAWAQPAQERTIKEVLELTNGSIVELDKLAGEPVDIQVNGKFLAKGEVVVIDENFGVRITEIASPAERAAKLQ